MRHFLAKILKRSGKKMATKIDGDNEAFLRAAQEQLRELARKGLSIPVFTL